MEKQRDNAQIWPPIHTSTWPQDCRNLWDSRGGEPLWGVHCMVNELLRHIWSDAKWSDLLGQLHWGVLHSRHTSITDREISRGLFLGDMLVFKGDNTGWNSRPCSSSDGEATSAVSMSMMVWKARKSYLFMVQIRKKKKQGRETHDGSSAQRNCIQGRRDKEREGRVVKTATCLALVLFFFCWKAALGWCLLCQGQNESRKKITGSDIQSSLGRIVQHHACCQGGRREAAEGRSIESHPPSQLSPADGPREER